MRNQPFHELSTSQGGDGRPWIDQFSRRRLLLMLLSLSMAVLVVIVRIAWVQAELQPRYLQVLNTTTTEYESIPARDGRILADPGHVLATDRDQYEVQVHYRWLQRKFDAGWLRRRLRERLTVAERRRPELVERETRALRQSRDRMWQRLSEVTRTAAEQLDQQRDLILNRVQRIADSVNERADSPSATHDLLPDDNLLLRLAGKLRRAVTSTPRRRQDRIVVREEESWHTVIRSVSFESAAVLREQPQRFPGVRVVARHRRIYPEQALAAHVVGARTLQPDASPVEGAGRAGDVGAASVGRFGVEYRFDHQLSGTAGRRRIVRNRRQEIIESVVERQPVNGRDVVLTLDVDLQRKVERLLRQTLLDELSDAAETNDVAETIDGAAAVTDVVPQPIPRGGCAIVMDVVHGRVLAAASAPAFDLTLFTNGSQSQWNRINADRRQPMFNRVTSMAIAPGSVIKPFTAAAAIENQTLQPDAAFRCQGYLQSPDRHRCLIYRLYGNGHGDLTLRRALAQSCNVYFFAAAERAGIQTLHRWFDAFGFGRPTGIDLPWEKSGVLPRVPEATGAHRTYRNQTLGLSIGQARLTTTPLQIARAMAAVANGGWLVTPHVVSTDGLSHTVSDPDDSPRRLSRHRIPGLDAATLESIREGLTAAVQQPFGTAYQTVRLDQLPIAGKTGTAETGSGQADHAWFAGYAPADHPQLVVVVALEHGGSGSRAAGPVAREIFHTLMEIGRLQRSDAAAAETESQSPR